MTGEVRNGEASDLNEVNEINEVTRRYLKAVDDFIEKAKKDVNVIAVIIMGSLMNDVVWEKSDIDAAVIVRDQLLKVPEFCIDADGIVLNVSVIERNKFVRSIEKTDAARTKVMYATDDSIIRMVEQNSGIGEKDAQKSAMGAACEAVYFSEKCEKWLYVKKDYTYCRYYVVKMAEALARIEIYKAKEVPYREVLQHVQKLNPMLTERFYYYPMSRELTKDELEGLLKEADDYLMQNIDYISAPVLDFLEEGEENSINAKTLTMFYRRFHMGGHMLVHLLEYFAQKGVIERASETVRLTPKSRPNFEEIAYISTKNIR